MLNLLLLHLIDEQYTKTPFFGYRKITIVLRERGYPVNKKRIQRLMQVLGLEAIYPKPNLSKPHPENRVYPYLLRGVPIERVNQVWSADITYIRLTGGWMYLVAVIDWFSRYVLAWEISNTLETDFCLLALERALEYGQQEVFNTDQGVSSQARRSQAFCNRPASPSAWMAADGRSTTSSSSVSGERSNTKRYI